jgi:hypothetical protein
MKLGWWSSALLTFSSGGQGLVGVEFEKKGKGSRKGKQCTSRVYI